MILWWKPLHDLMMQTCSWSYDENLFMIIWSLVHDLMMKSCSWSYDENLFMTLWWKLVHDLMMKSCSWSYDENLFMILWCKLAHDLMMKSCSWSYDENLFTILWWKMNEIPLSEKDYRMCCIYVLLHIYFLCYSITERQIKDTSDWERQGPWAVWYIQFCNSV
jgi:hypothetical protein